MVTIQRPGQKALILEVQVASTIAEKAKGLMFRKHLPQSEGMLFIFKAERELGFYMANCFIPLDMIFMNKDHKVVGILPNARPGDVTTRSIGKPSQFVLEVNGGFAAKHQITEGTIITWREWRK